jgi:hypothetical protein
VIEKIQVKSSSLSQPLQSKEKIFSNINHIKNIDNYHEINIEISDKQKILPEDLLEKFREVSAEVPDKYQISDRQVPDKYQISDRQVPDKYQISDRQVPDKYQISDRQVPDKRQLKTQKKLGKYSIITDFNFTCSFPLDTIQKKQRAVLDFLFERAVEQGGKQNRIARRVTIEQLVIITKSSKEASKDITRQLKIKDAIKVSFFVDGSSGWTDYILANNLHFELLMLKENEKLTQSSSTRQVPDKYQISGRQVPDEVPDKVPETVSNIITSYNSEEIIKTNNRSTSEPANFSGLPGEWQNIDWTGLEQFSYQLYPNEILGIYRAQQNPKIEGAALTLDAVQESINQMAHDLKAGVYKDSKFNPKGTLIGRLMKKMPYNASTGGYVSPRLRALKERAKRIEAERKEKEQLSETVFRGIFERWYQKQNKEQLRAAHSSYRMLSLEEHFKAAVAQDFRNQNFSKIIDEEIENPDLLSLEFGSSGPEKAQFNHEPYETETLLGEKQILELNQKIRNTAKILKDPNLNHRMRLELEQVIHRLKEKRKELINSDQAIKEKYADFDMDKFDQESLIAFELLDQKATPKEQDT